MRVVRWGLVLLTIALCGGVAAFLTIMLLKKQLSVHDRVVARSALDLVLVVLRQGLLLKLLALVEGLRQAVAIEQAVGDLH